MGYRGKLLVEHTAIELPVDFVNKYSEDYYISEYNGKHYMNISSKSETKGHYEIINDMKDLLKGTPYSVWAVVLWEDGAMIRINLCNGLEDRFPAPDDF